jgi:two-component sensor histidine kinase
MQLFFYTIIALGIAIAAIGQANNKEINKRMLTMSFISNKQNNTQLPIPFIESWDRYHHEETQYNSYKLLPTKTWKQQLVKQYEQAYNLKTKIDLFFSNILIDLSILEKALVIFILIIVNVLILLTHFLIRSIKTKKRLDLINNQLNENIAITNEQFSKNDFLLKELHHRVKNNLQLIYSLLNLQKRRIFDLEMKNNLTAVQNRIHTMSLVHELLYNTDNDEYININEYIKKLATHIKSIYKKENIVMVNFNIKEDLELEAERMIYLGLIINEIVSNTFKFELRNDKNSIINISVISESGIIEINISDNGPGFNINLVKSESLGLKLITVMCKQLNATHEISSNNGVQHIIKFSNKKPQFY